MTAQEALAQALLVRAGSPTPDWDANESHYLTDAATIIEALPEGWRLTFGWDAKRRGNWMAVGAQQERERLLRRLFPLHNHRTLYVDWSHIIGEAHPLGAPSEWTDEEGLTFNCRRCAAIQRLADPEPTP